MPRWLGAISVGAALAACGPAVTTWPEVVRPWMGSRKHTLKAGEEALKTAMSEKGVKLVQAPGNDEPVLVSGDCINGAWFTLPGPAKDMLGETFQYAWHLCVTDEQKFTLQLNCLEVVKSEQSTDSHQCAQGQVAKEVAFRSGDLLERMSAATK